MWTKLPCTTAKVSSKSASMRWVSSTMSFSVSSRERSRSRRCSRRNSTCSDRRAHSASASGLTGPTPSRRRSRRSRRSRSAAASSSPCGGLEDAHFESRGDLVEARGDFDAALLEPGDGHLRRPAAFAEGVDLAAQGDLVFGQAARGDPVAHPPLGLARLVAQPRDERLDAGLQRRQRGRHVGARRGRRRHSWPGACRPRPDGRGRCRRGAARGRARRRRAAAGRDARRARCAPR